MSNDLIAELKRQIGHSNYSEALNQMLNIIQTRDEENKKELKEIKGQIDQLERNLGSLKLVNDSLVKENNLHLVKQYSGKLVSLIDNDDYDQFKMIIEEHNYPINSYITQNFPDVCHMNLLHYA